MVLVKYGFTGTRNGLRNSQKNSIIHQLQNEINIGNDIEVHHGDCIGADNDFHDICANLILKNPNSKIKIVIHPPTDNKLRAYCKSNSVCKEKTYLERNKDIVDNTEILIGCPYDNEEKLRSGTWSTIRYAKKNNKTVLLFF